MKLLLTRIAEEKRAILVPLTIAIVLNIVAYFFVVRPLGVHRASWG